MHNLSCENEFYLHENEKWSPYERLSTYPSFETEAQGNSEIAYYNCKRLITWPQNVNTAHCLYTITKLHAKKVMSDSLGLVNFAIGLSSILKLPDGQTMLSQNKNYKRTVIKPAHQKLVFVLVEKTYGLENASYSLPKAQAVKSCKVLLLVFTWQFPMAQLHCTFRA